MIELGESLNHYRSISHRRFDFTQASQTIPTFSAVTRNTAQEVYAVQNAIDYRFDAWQIREYMDVTYVHPPKKKNLLKRIGKWITS